MSTNYIDQITDTASTPVTYDISESDSTRLFRATCSSSASTGIKVATLDTSNKNFELTTGVRVAVTFQYGNTAQYPRLQVNGENTGTAAYIAFATAADTVTPYNGDTYNTWGPYETIIFTYDGTYWVQSGSSLAINKAYTSRGTWYGTCSTTASTEIKDVVCSNYVLETGTLIGVTFTTGNTHNTPRLRVNSSASGDAKYIMVGNASVNGTNNVLKWSSGTTIYFLYSGTYYYYITAIASGATGAQPRGGNTWFGLDGSSAYNSATKTCSITNYVLATGAVVSITFANANSVADALTLNISDTGAKTIKYNNSVTSTTNPLFWDAGDTLTFIYNGSSYVFVTKSKHTNITYGSSDPSGAAETGTVYFKTGASAYTFQPRVNLTRTTDPALPTPITTTEQTMHSFTLPPGMYLITFQVNHSTYTAGTCRWDLKAGSNTITQIRTCTGATTGMIQNGCGLVQCTDASTTISFTAVVSSGTMTTGELHYSYIKLF